jgi:hypothetical protein
VVQPVEDVHQRRLSGAVLAEERVHLPGPEVERHVVVGDDAGKRLPDAAHLEDRRLGHDAILTLRYAKGGPMARPSAVVLPVTRYFSVAGTFSLPAMIFAL